MTLSLRDALLAALAQLPGTREFHLHVLVSSPQKHASLFRFAVPRPRAYLQQILVLLSEQTTPDSPRILVTAIEASVYNIPSTSCAILYISKVDSTGQAAAPSPTYALVRSLLTYYADPATRPLAAETLWIHLFARAQGQYLFPNSVEYEGKRPLSDIKLCAWWKRVFTDVADVLEERTPASSKPKPQTKLYYILPGYTEFEAVHALKNASSSTVSITSTTGSVWFYGHPYSQTEITLPCPPDHTSEGQTKNLGHFIPSFDDDPKSRFIDEIAYITDGEIKSPKRKRSRTSSHNEGSHSNDDGSEEKKEGERDNDDRPLGELDKTTPDDFWERMSFRQECVAGAVTGFFIMGISPSAGDGDRDVSSAGTMSPLAPQPGQVSSQLNKRILTTLTTSVEFSTKERAIRGTEVIENAIRGLCEGIAPIPTTMGRAVRTFPKVREIDRRTPERETLIQPSTPTGITGWTTSSSPSYSLLAPPSTPPPRFGSSSRMVADMISPNPFPEPVASLETYHSHIYGTIKVKNVVVAVPVGMKAGSAATESKPQITVLTVRKKKKRAE